MKTKKTVTKLDKIQIKKEAIATGGCGGAPIAEYPRRRQDSRLYFG